MESVYETLYERVDKLIGRPHKRPLLSSTGDHAAISELRAARRTRSAERARAARVEPCLLGLDRKGPRWRAASAHLSPLRFERGGFAAGP